MTGYGRMLGMIVLSLLAMMIRALALLLMGSGVALAQDVGSDAGGRPNILLILVDDMGIGDLQSYGARDTRTPHIDRLARQGVRFTQAYSSGNLCTPTRAGLLSGQYQQRIGVEDVGDVLPRSVTTMAQRLRSAGYATGMAGKWHLGHAVGFRPIDRGFAEYFGYLAGWCNFPGCRFPLLRNTTRVPHRQYLPDAFADEMVRFIRAHQRAPWFFYMAYNQPHIPVQAPEALLRQFAHIPDLRRRTLAATLSAVDTGIGRALDALADTGQLRQTLVIFASDNGAPIGGGSANGSSNGILRGRKGTTYEGGIRVPLLMQWPGVLPAGVDYRKPVITMDITATALGAAGVPARGAPRDGVNLHRYVTGSLAGVTPHQTLYWRNREHGNFHAVRQGPWKLVWSAPVRQYQLFNLEADPREQQDLAHAMPGQLAELRRLYQGWSAGVDASAAAR